MLKYHFNGQQSDLKDLQMTGNFLMTTCDLTCQRPETWLGIGFLWIETWPYRLETWSRPKRLDFEMMNVVKTFLETCHYKISGWNWTCLKTWYWLVFKDLRVDLKLSRMTRPDLRLPITIRDTFTRTCLERLETCYWICLEQLDTWL